MKSGISIIKLKGGLGNQMFQYAFYLSLKKKCPLTLSLFDNEESLHCHNGITLDCAFNIKSATRAKWFRWVRSSLPSVIRRAHRVEQENALMFDERYFSKHGLVTIFDGYWQSEKYFAPVADKVRKAFRFRREEMNSRTLQFAETLQKGTFVSVHVRRGDYLPLVDYHGLCSETYYHDAMRYMSEKLPNAVFVFFSDDMDWVKENLNSEGAVYVDWNQGKDSWQDMYLMSQCKCNIVANSSFSWWGAWLNGNANKIVIAPSRWFTFSSNYDILPNSWITL